ncbi:TOBE domain-containing protein [Blastococcus sp. SYSU DS1024]
MAATYRIAEAATLLGVSDDTVRRWVDSGRLPARREGAGPAVVDGADLARLAAQLREAPEPGTTPSSARNRLAGIVTNVVRDGVMAQVEIQAGPFRIVSLMSREAADELGLVVGVRAVATVKATQVSVDVP